MNQLITAILIYLSIGVVVSGIWLFCLKMTLKRDNFEEIIKQTLSRANVKIDLSEVIEICRTKQTKTLIYNIVLWPISVFNFFRLTKRK